MATEKRLPTEAALLLDDAALFTHQRVVSVNLAGKSRQCTSDKPQSIAFSLTPRQFHQSTTFC
jgi:hypothetical protein